MRHKPAPMTATGAASPSTSELLVLDSPYELARWRSLTHWLLFVPHGIMVSQATTSASTYQSGNPAPRANMIGERVAVGEATMTVAGTTLKTHFFLVILGATGFVGWDLVNPPQPDVIVWPSWLWWVMLIAFIVAVVTGLNPRAARGTGTIYVGLEGFSLGALSAVYEIAFDGIVLSAAVVTVSLLLSVLVLYGFGIVKVTAGLAREITAAVGAIALLYLFG